jgi:hypothetical protein
MNGRGEGVFGPNHPEVLAAQARLAEAGDTTFKSPVLVLTRSGTNDTTIRDARVKPLGGRQFLVGTEVKNDYTRGSFVGKQLWIPLDDVTKLVEIGDQKPEK